MQIYILSSKYGCSYFQSQTTSGQNIRFIEIPNDFNLHDSLHESEISWLIDAWNKFRLKTQQATRYNSPIRFINKTIQSKKEHPIPFAFLFIDGVVKAALVASVHIEKRKFPFSLQVSQLKCGETGMITDGSSDANNDISRFINHLLQNNKNIEEIRIHNFILGNSLYDSFINNIGKNIKSIKKEQIRWKRLLIDPKTKEPIQHNSAKTRQTIRRKYRRLSKIFEDDFNLIKVTQPDEMDEFVKQSANIVNQTYQAALGIGARYEEKYLDFVREMASEGLLRGYLFLGQGEPISYVIGDLDESNTFHLWATSFNPRFAKFSPGIVLLYQLFDDLIEQRVEWFDFGYGEAQYKQTLGSHKQLEVDFALFAPGIVPSIAFLIEYFEINIKKSLRQAIVSMGYLDRLRRILRTFLQKWQAKLSKGIG